ncbi:MAG TPA: DUF1998 domain-containing protein, partial [Candidatus Stackebrandtia faecavium]|nr:DUF1998 domain-containing protein [Candidatus Stackebrandtia faecavium]
ARVFPQWLRCSGCDLLGKITQFEYTNTSMYRPDQAKFEHSRCQGKKGESKPSSRLAVPARYLLTCQSGHLDEFPYEAWVHGGNECPAAELPALKMDDKTAGKGASAIIKCESCQAKRPMNEAQGESGAAKLPGCRGRHPHLSTFDSGKCRNSTRLMLVGASNLWFPVTQSIIVMPTTSAEKKTELADKIRTAADIEKLNTYRDNLEIVRMALDGKVDVKEVPDEALREAVDAACAYEVSVEEQEERVRNWDPIDLLVPEWRYLQDDPPGPFHEDKHSGLTLSRRARSPKLPAKISRVLAVERLRKVNALVGFTRVDSLDRVNDQTDRLVPLTRERKPKWTVATEDRGEGVFIQLDEEQVVQWEDRVLASPRWAEHREAHRRNFGNRLSDTASMTDPDNRFSPPRYWLVHTFAHVLMREMAQMCGYSAASLSERLYAWPKTEEREAAAGFLICTTASDSDGTLGGLVQLSEPHRLAKVVDAALLRATRCSSDPICAMRIPKDPEDFLHGAACHCCAMASETSCEKANRFLDRRFLVNLPGCNLGFFGYVEL